MTVYNLGFGLLPVLEGSLGWACGQPPPLASPRAEDAGQWHQHAGRGGSFEHGSAWACSSCRHARQQPAGSTSVMLALDRCCAGSTSILDTHTLEGILDSDASRQGPHPADSSGLTVMDTGSLEALVRHPHQRGRGVMSPMLDSTFTGELPRLATPVWHCSWPCPVVTRPKQLPACATAVAAAFASPALASLFATWLRCLLHRLRNATRSSTALRTSSELCLQQHREALPCWDEALHAGRLHVRVSNVHTKAMHTL